jgi:hypothetical protein
MTYIDRFPDSKHACAYYLGLVPWLDETADVTHLGHITKKEGRQVAEEKPGRVCESGGEKGDPHLKEFYTRLTHKREERRRRR